MKCAIILPRPGGMAGLRRSAASPGGRARECAKLAGASDRPQGTRPGSRARAGDWRRGTRLLESAGRGVADSTASALYGPQDRQCGGQAAQVGPAGCHRPWRSVCEAASGIAARGADLREVWNAPDRATAKAAIATFAEKYGAKYKKAVTSLTKDQDALLTFYYLPAEHWDRLRTSHGVQAGDGGGHDLAPAAG